MQHAWAALLPWTAVVYFGVRVHLDAQLMDLMATDATPEALDNWLLRTRLKASLNRDRDVADRCRGARRLTQYLTGAFAMQVIVTVALSLGSKQ